MQKHIVLIVILVFWQTTFYAQENLSALPPFIRPYLNKIKNPHALDSFFLSLQVLEKEKTGQINIVHLGDSHLQAGFISKEIREGLQQKFGNAGRGLIFPYGAAKSNGPDDISSSSTIQWNYNRLTHPEISLPTGVSGFCLSKENATGTLSVSLKHDEFSNILLFFLRNSSAKNALYSTNSGNGGTLNLHADSNAIEPVKLKLHQPANKFTILFPPESNATATTSFYGMSATSSACGVVYHSIGVNGACFRSYLQSEYFFKQLPYLSASLYIVSLGTNEAQKQSLSEDEFENDLNEFYGEIKRINPHAIVLLTTPASSFYKNKTVNTKIEMIRNCILSFAQKYSLPYWDLFEISCGNAAQYWRNANLMANDGVHYNKTGYSLQGQLLLQAMLQGYEDFCKQTFFKTVNK